MKTRLAVLLVALLAPLLISPAVSADADDFRITKYLIDYSLSKDSEGRSVLQTTETITAQFPDYDQNHGIERAIPESYDGHKTSLAVNAVKKANGSAWSYTTYKTNYNLVLRIGNADSYVHGFQTYVISYSQRDVTNYFADTNDDEFYWDTNGTEWRVPIDRLAIRINLQSGLEGALNGQTACYAGVSGSTDHCTLRQSKNQISTAATSLSPGENITVAIGFKPQTFVPYQPTFWETVLGYLYIVWFISFFVLIIGVIWMVFKRRSIVERTKEIGTVVPEYLPPKDVSVTAAAEVIHSPRAIFAAQLLDFAVRHYIKLYEIEKTSILWFKNADYEIEIVRDPGPLKAEEREILSDIFGGLPSVGDKLALSSLKNNTAVYRRTQDNSKKLKKLIRGQYGLREKSIVWVKRMRTAAVVMVLIGILSLNFVALIAAVFVFALSFSMWALTDKGLELSRYLQGLKLYIQVAETERIKMLQSPEGAEKIGRTDPKDNKQLVKLYEKVLPYAVLFGQEKEWNKQIGALYENLQQNPDWYVGNRAFTAVAFSHAISGFSSAAAYSAANSSSSGGSSGGGSSGGGGGGGGGGGW